MIIVIVSNTITLTLTADEMVTSAWINDIYGSGELVNVLNGFFAQKKAQMNETKKNDFWTLVKDNPTARQAAIDVVNPKVTFP